MLRVSLIVCWSTFLVGCGQTGEKCYPVSGRVTLEDGQPLIGGRVSFESSSGKVSAEGYTDVDGHFQMTTYNSGDGALPGEHRIIVIAPPSNGQSSQQRYEEVSKFEGVTAEDLAALKNAPPPVALDPKYSQFATSGLTFTVEPGNNACDLTLQRK